MGQQRLEGQERCQRSPERRLSFGLGGAVALATLSACSPTGLIEEPIDGRALETSSDTPVPDADATPSIDDDGVDPPAEVDPPADDVTADDDPPSVSCPPPGPYGTSVGDVAEDVVLADCDGGTHSVHDLCSRPAAWIYLFAGW